MRLTKKKKQILELCKSPVTMNSILDKLGVAGCASKRDKLRALRRTLEAMINDGLIERKKDNSVIIRKRKHGDVKNKCVIWHYQVNKNIAEIK